MAHVVLKQIYVNEAIVYIDDTDILEFLSVLHRILSQMAKLNVADGNLVNVILRE